MMVSSSDFFAEYHGHRVAHLERLAAALRPRRLIFLAGDSTLDNKFWVLSSPPVPARNGVESALSPPVCAPDVACALNAELAAAAAAAAAAASPFACLNCAVEESTLRGRVAAGGALALAQDAFAARSLEAGDVLVISAGGNDVVLAPTLATAAAVAALLLFASEAALRDGSAWGMATLVALFRGEVERYARAVRAERAGAARHLLRLLPSRGSDRLLGGRRARADGLRAQPGATAANHARRLRARNAARSAARRASRAARPLRAHGRRRGERGLRREG